mmetsp:Transcript_39987/g.92534  ORF Transcript_39987/g.92534 Transcript_39987/m.92534 type:complete len:238 (-) Transcript_39987:384-1097(-)
MPHSGAAQRTITATPATAMAATAALAEAASSGGGRVGTADASPSVVEVWFGPPVGEPAPSSESFVDPELCSDAFWEVVGTAWPSSADVDDTLDASSPEARLDVDVAVEDGAEIGVVEVVVDDWVVEDEEEVGVAVTVKLLLLRVVVVEDRVVEDEDEEEVRVAVTVRLLLLRLVVAEDDEEVAVAVTVELLLVKVVAVEDDVLVDVAVLVLVDGCVRAQSTNDVLAAAEARPSEFAQ